MYLKKTALGLVLPIIFLVACSKEGNHSMPPANLSIAGKWNFLIAYTFIFMMRHCHLIAARSLTLSRYPQAYIIPIIFNSMMITVGRNHW